MQDSNVGRSGLKLAPVPLRPGRGRLSLSMASLVALWRLLECRKPRSWDPGRRRAGLLKDMSLVAARGPRGCRVLDLPAEKSSPFSIPARRLYAAESGVEPTQVIVYFHGGGYVLGSPDTVDGFCRRLCLATRSLVVSVDYRLAPEHPYPAALEDARAVWSWLCSCARDDSPDTVLGERRLELAGGLPLLVAGDSAGAHLALTLCLALRGEQAAPGCLLSESEADSRPAARLPAAQVLLYPVVRFDSFESASYRLYGKGFVLEQADMEWFRSCLLGDSAQQRHPLVSPLLAESLAGLPPALILTAEFDVLRDEGEALAARLQASGVPVKAGRMNGAIHGFATMTAVGRSAGIAIRHIATFIRQLAPASCADGA